MTTNKPEVKPYSPITHDGRSAMMQEDDFGGWVRTGNYYALQAEFEKLGKDAEYCRMQLQSMIDQTTPREPVPSDPKWSRRIQLDDVIAERDSLQAECEKLRCALEDVRSSAMAGQRVDIGAIDAAMQPDLEAR